MREYRIGLAALLAFAVAVAVAIGGGAGAAPGTDRSAPCAAPPASVEPLAPTTITTIEQAYYCVFAHYYAGPVLDDQVLLAGAFAGFTQRLDRLGLASPDAALPALTGDRDRDWVAFAATYRRVTGRLRVTAAQRQELAAATMTGLVDSLGDNHAHWAYPVEPPGYRAGDAYGLGITTSPRDYLASTAPAEALPPLYVTAVAPGSPAATAGLLAGDVIESVDGAPPFTDDVVSEGVIDLLFAQYPDLAPVSVRLLRPATGRTWSVRLAPAVYPSPSLAPVARLVSGDTAYVTMPAFAGGSADQVLSVVSALARGTGLRGVVLDLRGNQGGSPAEVARLLGAFVHGAAYSYDCDVRGACTANRTDATVPLLHLPLVVLTDRGCASACDAFAAAVKDLHLGLLVGTRSAGIVAGAAAGFQLQDNSLLIIPTHHQLAADHELVNGIGVPPDHYSARSAADLSTGHDPALTKALTLLNTR